MSGIDKLGKGLRKAGEARQNIQHAEPRSSFGQPAGSAAFQKLCDDLISDGSYNYLCPEISRTRSADWVARISTHHDPGRKSELALGQGSTLDEACGVCVANYHIRRRDEARLQKLLKNPDVREAIKLMEQNK